MKYTGMRVFYDYENINPSRENGDFVVIDPGTAMKQAFNIASYYDFKPGKYSIQYFGNLFHSMPISDIVHFEVKEKTEFQDEDSEFDYGEWHFCREE